MSGECEVCHEHTLDCICKYANFIIRSHTPDDVWHTYITDTMQSDGWTKDRDDEKTLGFSLIEGEHHWMRDYDKKTRRFVQFDGNQKVNLRVTKE